MLRLLQTPLAECQNADEKTKSPGSRAQVRAQATHLSPDSQENYTVKDSFDGNNEQAPHQRKTKRVARTSKTSYPMKSNPQLRRKRYIYAVQCFQTFPHIRISLDSIFIAHVPANSISFSIHFTTKEQLLTSMLNITNIVSGTESQFDPVACYQERSPGQYPHGKRPRKAKALAIRNEYDSGPHIRSTDLRGMPAIKEQEN